MLNITFHAMKFHNLICIVYDLQTPSDYWRNGFCLFSWKYTHLLFKIGSSQSISATHITSNLSLNGKKLLDCNILWVIIITFIIFESLMFKKCDFFMLEQFKCSSYIAPKWYKAIFSPPSRCKGVHGLFYGPGYIVLAWYFTIITNFGINISRRKFLV